MEAGYRGLKRFGKNAVKMVSLTDLTGRYRRKAKEIQIEETRGY